MPRIIDGVEYLNAAEAIEQIGGSRQSFYNNIKSHLRPYRLGSRKTPMYSKQEVLAVANGKPIRKAMIPITGMFTDWTKHARSLGYNAITENRDVKILTLPRELAESFHISPDQVFVKRGRMTTIDGSPVASWDTYYPVEWVSDILAEIQQGTACDIVEHIQQVHGLTINRAFDRSSTRITSLEELNLFRLLNDEPVFVLQRVAWTADKQIIVLFSDMVLLGSWFVVERDEEVHNWDKRTAS